LIFLALRIYNEIGEGHEAGAVCACVYLVQLANLFSIVDVDGCFGAEEEKVLVELCVEDGEEVGVCEVEGVLVVLFGFVLAETVGGAVTFVGHVSIIVLSIIVISSFILIQLHGSVGGQTERTYIRQFHHCSHHLSRIVLGPSPQERRRATAASVDVLPGIGNAGLHPTTVTSQEDKEPSPPVANRTCPYQRAEHVLCYLQGANTCVVPVQKHRVVGTVARRSATSPLLQ
jgi:hypothetical protein